MERQPFNQPDEDDDGQGKRKHIPGVIGAAQNSNIPPRQQFEQPRRLPPSHAFEGVISWRDKDEVIDSDRFNDPVKGEKDDSDAEDETDTKKSSSSKNGSKHSAFPGSAETPTASHEPVVHSVPMTAEKAWTEDSPEDYPSSEPDQNQPPEIYEAQIAETSVWPSDAEWQPKPQFVPYTESPQPVANVPHTSSYNQQPVATTPHNYDYSPTTPTVRDVPPSAPNIHPGNAVNFQPNGAHHNYNSSYYSPDSQAFHNTSPDAPALPGRRHEAPAPAMPIEHPAPSYGRDSQVGGLAAMLGLEFFARRRADRKLEKRVSNRQDERFGKQEHQMAEDYRRLQEQQRQFAAEQERQHREMQNRQFHETTPQFSEAPRSTPDLPKPFEASQAVPAGHEVAGQPGQRPYAEQQVRPVTGRPEQASTMPQQANVEQSIPDHANEQTMHVGQHEHVQHSAWHNIVVDERGHEVAGAIHYGEGFKRERQQEAIREPVVTGSGQASSTGASGGMTHDQFGTPMLPSGMTTPSLTQGQNSPVDPQHQLPANSTRQPSLANPWFWLMLALIIAAFFTAALI